MDNKEYALYIGENVTEMENDHAEWFADFATAYAAGLSAVESGETDEAYILGFYANGDCEDFGRCIVREDGAVHEYENGERLWL